MDDLRESSPLLQGWMNLNEVQMENLSSLALDNTIQNTVHNLDPLLGLDQQLLLIGDSHLQDATFLMGLEHQIPEMKPDSTRQNMSVPPISPVSTSKMPSTEDYPGPFAFDVELNNSGEKTKWKYSESLNKLFINMHCNIPVKFKTNQNEYGLYVRVMPIYLAEDSFTVPVQRCPAHESLLEESNKDFPHVDHIMRCHHESAMYEKDIESYRLSVLVPLENPQPGCNWSTVMYSFVCKNSCNLGMSRRSTALIFTLERQNGEVIGRRLMNVRICCCPSRDKEKEEQNLSTNNLVVNFTSDKCVMGSGKKPLKRLKKNDLENVRLKNNDRVDFRLRVPTVYAKYIARTIKEMISMNEKSRKLTSEEEEEIMCDCDKYIC